MEEDILAEPYSTVLYRESSIQTLSNISLNLHDENSDKESCPKIVDVQVKNSLKIVDKSHERNASDKVQDQIHNFMKNEIEATIVGLSEENYNITEETSPEKHEDILFSNKKKLLLLPSKKKDAEHKESDANKLLIPMLFQDSENKLYKTNECPLSGHIYLDMKSPRSLISTRELDSTPSEAKVVTCSEQKQIVSEYNNLPIPIYTEMKFALDPVNVSKEIKFGNSSVHHSHCSKDSLNEQTSENLPGRYDNLMRNTHIYEELTDGDEFVTSVALLKVLKSKSQSSDELENIEKNNIMATVRPKSPKPIISKNEKDESFWDKIGTLGRKKRIKEVQEIQEEGKYAIDSPGFAVTAHVPPEEYDLDENEERSIIMPKAFEDPRLRELIQVLIDWINDELASQRIIVQDLTEDLYDGQVFQKLFEMLTGHKLDVPEVTQSEEGQKQKLSVVLSHFNRVLGLPHIHNKWNVEVIHSKSMVPILHLLVALARHFRPPVRLPENVSVSVTVVQKTQGQLTHRIVREVITSEYSDVGMICERDAFDTLFDHAPDKLQVVKKSMVTFVNKHLNKLNLEVTEIETQFHDGVYLLMLMGLLEGFFVPLYSFFPTPKDNDQKVHNVSFAFELMEEIGLSKPKARPEDVVNLDLKSTLRVLYNLFNKYKFLL